MIVVATHYTLVEGKRYEAPSSTLIEILEHDKQDFLVIRHSLDGSGPSSVHTYHRGLEQTSRRLPVPSGPAPLRYLAEVVVSVAIMMRYRKRSVAFIGVDPLNALAGRFLRLMRIVRRTVFFTADFTPTRFDNRVLNGAYQRIDRWCVSQSDEVWSVSTRIADYRRSQGLPEERNFFVPNVPAIPADTCAATPDRVPRSVVTLGILGPQQDYTGLIEAMEKLRPEFPDCRLTIVGNGPSEGDLRAFVAARGLQDVVRFAGHLDHTSALDEIARSAVGAAVYNGEWSFNHFGDSMKCREFMHYGLPILTTDSHSTVDEIREFGAGLVCEQSAGSYADALRAMFSDPARYESGSLALGHKYVGIHQQRLSSLDGA